MEDKRDAQFRRGGDGRACTVGSFITGRSSR